MGGCHSSDFPAASSEVPYRRREINLNEQGSETKFMDQNHLREKKKEQANELGPALGRPKRCWLQWQLHSSMPASMDRGEHDQESNAML